MKFLKAHQSEIAVSESGLAPCSGRKSVARRPLRLHQGLGTGGTAVSPAPSGAGASGSGGG